MMIEHAMLRPDVGVVVCDHPDCARLGHFRAPRSRAELRVYYWFCLDHVREYNAEWNYYSGMTEAEVELERRGDTVWHRPTWPFGSQPSNRRAYDVFGLFEDGPDPLRRAPPRPANPEEDAMATLGLTAPVTVVELKKRYKDLVKRHHPDVNGGDNTAEEKLKSINHAYDLLRQAYV